MKAAQLCVFILLFFVVACEALPSAKVTVKVTDEFGKPLADAPVISETLDRYQHASEWGGEEPIYKQIIFKTDARGIAIVKIPQTEASVVCVVRNYPGFYTEERSITFTNSFLGHWLPLNPELDFVLQKIGVQIPMYAGHIFLKKVPGETKSVGFDLMVGDWVEPYGNGKTSDLIFHFDIAPTTWITNSYGKKLINDRGQILAFSNDGDGIQTFESLLKHGLRSPRQAPLDGYESSIRFHQVYQPNGNYFFRVRSKKDEKGNIVSALYGKIYGDFKFDGKEIDFTYFLNPEPNSRNMEFDPGKNLLVTEALEASNKLIKKSQNWNLDENDLKELSRLGDLRRDSLHLGP
jgi:hypothetical protein